MSSSKEGCCYKLRWTLNASKAYTLSILRSFPRCRRWIPAPNIFYIHGCKSVFLYRLYKKNYTIFLNLDLTWRYRFLFVWWKACNCPVQSYRYCCKHSDINITIWLHHLDFTFTFDIAIFNDTSFKKGILLSFYPIVYSIVLWRVVKVTDFSIRKQWRSILYYEMFNNAFLRWWKLVKLLTNYWLRIVIIVSY